MILLLHPRRSLLLLTLLVLMGIGSYEGGRYLWSRKQYHAAQQAVLRRDLAQARAQLSFCLRAWPSAEAHLLAARIARLEGQFDDVDEHLTACYQLGGPPEALRLERELMRAQRGFLDLGVEEYLQDRVVQDHPDTPLILEALGQGYAKTMRMPQALYCLTLWSTRQPDNPQPLIQRGSLRRRLRQYRDAEADYQKALALDADNFEARLLLAGVQLELGWPDLAAKDFERLYQIEPENPVVGLGLVQSLLRMGRTDRARQILDHLLALHPQDAFALRERGQLALQAGQPAQAEACLRQALALEPLDREVYYNLALCLQEQHKEDEAKKCLAKSDQIAAALTKLEDLTVEMLKSPTNPAPRRNAGVILLDLGMDQEGLRWLFSALREAPADRPTHLILADYYLRIDQPDRAAHHRQLAQGK